MQTAQHTAFAAIPYFAAIAPERLGELESLCSVQDYAPEQIIFVYGDPGDALFLVAEGGVEVFTHNNAGAEIALEMIDVGDVFGEVALFNGDTRAASAKALGPAVLLRVERGHVPAVLALCPALTDALLSGMARRLRTSGDKLRHLTTFDINALKGQRQTAFDRVCARIVDVIAGVPFLGVLVAGYAWWVVHRPFRDGNLGDLALTVDSLGLLVALLVLLNQRREEKSAAVVDAEESFAIRQAAKELQYLHEKLDAALSLGRSPETTLTAERAASTGPPGAWGVIPPPARTPPPPRASSPDPRPRRQ